MRADFHKPPAEVLLSEIYPVTTEIDHARRHLRSWMRPRRARLSLTFPGARTEVRYEPKGVCLIVAPWNFPFQLALGPLTSAIAAGNRAIVKPSELTPHTSRLLSAVVSAAFPEDEAAVIEGDASVGQELIGLPFDHIFFTGSTAVGRLVLAAAAKNLSSVTLELGGKSPAVIDETADLENAARRIAWGTLINAGQTCVAPDYAIVPRARIDAFVGQLRRSIEDFYGAKIRSNPDYCRIVNQRHFDRIRHLVEEAVARGARVEIGGEFDPSDHYVSPTVVTGVDPDSDLLKEEIFGPVLPIVAYDREQDAVDFVRRRGRPLALYLFSRRKDWIERMLSEIPSGDAVINDVVAHFVHPNLPFGGVGESGMGKAHGYSGFVAFSHERSVLRQPGWTMMRLLYPPYRPRVMRLLRLTIRFLSGR